MSLKRTLLTLPFFAVLSVLAEAPAHGSTSLQSDQRSDRHATTNVVDYAGQPCGDQHLHVKVPVCLFPRVERTPLPMSTASASSAGGQIGRTEAQ
jgi:hypothetical protein